jgi:hypothetical protein
MVSARNSTTPFFRTRVQSVTGGAHIYNSLLSPNEPTFEEVYHDVWRIFFTPAPAVRSMLEHEMQEMGLVPGDYSAAHLRLLYGRIEERTPEQATEWTHNAVNCASKLRPGGPFLLASDYTYATEVAIEYGKEKGTRVVSRKHDKQPLHFDKADLVEQRKPQDFYDTFVDLYLMGMSKCLAYNRGGFGTWALLIGYNSTCSYNQKTSVNGIADPCDWTEPETPVTKAKSSGAPLFLEPMGDDALVSLSPGGRRKLTNLSSQALPQWMTDYFDWHNQTKSSLNEDNFNDTKYIIMSCEKNHPSCGGISDRLKPLPFVVLVAARSKRLLLIHWIRPKSLEEFLIPPEGGVDWRAPQWLKPLLKKLGGDLSHGVEDADKKVREQSDDPVIKLRIQTPSAGEAWYAQQLDSHSTYADVFHGLFRAFFTPVPRLAAVIEQHMKEHHLVPGEYSATHLRAMYGNRKWRNPNETIALAVNGINCASNLYPGAPVYFAADIKFAVQVAQEYGRQRSLPVGSLDFNDNPLHFDKDKTWFERDASAYDDTFLDLYMLAQSRCVAYSNGGYGTFGMLLSHDASCAIRFFKGRKPARNCTWTYQDGTQAKLPPPIVSIPSELLIKPK